jgi:hypothetical protein
VILEVHQKVAGLLSHPLTGGAGGDAGQMHAAGAVLNEEQHVQAAQEHGVDVEEIHGQDRGGLPAQKRSPGLPGPPGRGIDARVLEDLPHRRRRHRVSQPGQLAVDAPVPPGRVILRHLQHQRAYGMRGTEPPITRLTGGWLRVLLRPGGGRSRAGR